MAPQGGPEGVNASVAVARPSPPNDPSQTSGNRLRGFAGRIAPAFAWSRSREAPKISVVGLEPGFPRISRGVERGVSTRWARRSW